jgi:hypothetical protein
MLPHGRIREPEPAGDLAVGVARRDETQQLPLPVGEAVGRPGAQSVQMRPQQSQERPVTLAEIRSGTTEQHQSDRTPGGLARDSVSSRCTPAGRAADRWEKFGPLLAVGRSSLSADVVTVDGRRSLIALGGFELLGSTPVASTRVESLAL